MIHWTWAAFGGLAGFIVGGALTTLVASTKVDRLLGAMRRALQYLDRDQKFEARNVLLDSLAVEDDQ